MKLLIKTIRLVLLGGLSAVLAGAPSLAGPQLRSEPPASHADPRWGFYAGLAGDAWISHGSEGQLSLIHYRWNDAGTVLRAEHRTVSGAVNTVETIKLGPAPDQLTIETTMSGFPEASVSRVSLNPDGSAVETWIGPEGTPERTTYLLVEPDRYLAMTERQIGGAWRVAWRSEITRVSSDGADAKQLTSAPR